jgi:hypothetical protein
MDDGSLCVPEQILEQILDLVNQVRAEYHVPALEFHQELSFIAGEQACNMSTGQVPYGHGGFEDRQAQVPLAFAFSENVASMGKVPEPAQAFVVDWLSKPECFSRIISSFTHTGIGVAESTDGVWYVVQNFATFHPVTSRKDQFLLVTRFINRIRILNSAPRLAVSISAAAKLKHFCRSAKGTDPLANVNSKLCLTFFYDCMEALTIHEVIPAGPASFEAFLDSLKTNETNLTTLMNSRFTDIVYGRRESQDVVAYMLVFGICERMFYTPTSQHVRYPVSFGCLQLVNDYRVFHHLEPLNLSHSWCKLAQKLCDQIVGKTAKMEGTALAKKICDAVPGSHVNVAIDLISGSIDPLRELLLMWISRPKSKARLRSDATHFGLGYEATEKGCYAVRLIGTIPKKSKKWGTHICSPAGNSQYESISDSDEEQQDEQE